MRTLAALRSLSIAPLAAVLIVTGAGAVTPSSAGAQAWRDQVADQILDSRIVQTLLADGYRRSHDPYFDLTPSGGSSTVTITMRAGLTYRIVGKCDNDCADLDLRLRDGRAVLDSDFQRDDYPVITFTPSYSGTYALDAVMASCQTRTCGWGVVILARQATTASAPSRSGSATSASLASSRERTDRPASNTAWRDQVERQLMQSGVARTFTLAGFARSHDLFYDLLPQRESQFVRLDLRAGQSYVMVGKCDNDCSDVDFTLLDENGYEVDRDVTTDDVPVVRVTPVRSATYRLKVTMAQCRTATCGWGVMVMSR